MRPIVHGLQQEYLGKIDFIYLDIDDPKNQDMMHQLTFTGLRPTIVFLSPSGQEKSRLVGQQTEDVLRAQIENLLG